MPRIRRTTSACLLVATGMAASADDHGDTADAATAVTLGVAISGSIDPAGDVDYFSLELEETADVVFSTSGSLDTLGTLYDADEDELESDDDDGAGVNFRIRRELSAGTYYVGVRAFARRTGDYELSATLAAPDDHGDSRDTATDLPLGTSVGGYLDPGDVDFFRVEVGQTTGAIITTTGGLDLTGRLYDVDGNQLVYDDDSGDDRNFRIRARLEPGTYFAETKAWSSRTEGEYEIWAIPVEWANAVCEGYGDRTAPLVPAAGWPDGREGFVRLVSVSERSQIYDFVAVDDAGNSYDLNVVLEPLESVHFNSDDLEYGNLAKGRLLGTGAAPEIGHWRLCMPRAFFGRVAASAYVRTRDGFLTAMNGMVPRRYTSAECRFLGDDPIRSNDCRYWNIPLFNPASNVNQASSLRLANNSGEPQRVAIVGYREDGGRNREGGDPLVVTGTIPARAAVVMSAQQLETGAGLPLEDASGRIGPAEGKWDIEVWAGENAALVVVNLMETSTGHLTNLSDAVHLHPFPRGASSSDARIAADKAAVEAKERAGSIWMKSAR